MQRPWLLLGWVLSLSVLGLTDLGAQNINVARQPGPYYVGLPTVVQVRVSELAGGQEANCTYAGESQLGLSVSAPGVKKSTRSMMSSFNGRMTRRDSVELRFTFNVTADREGAYRVGPFQVVIDGKEQTVDGIVFDFEPLESDPEMQVELSIDDESIYVGEEVPVRIKWTYSGDLDELDYVFDQLRFSSRLFEDFEFKDRKSSSGNTMTLTTHGGQLQIGANAQRVVRNGRTMIEVIGERVLVAEGAGEYEDLTVSCRTERVTGWGRDIFGSVRPRSTRPAIANSEPMSFSVKALPGEGRPSSFSGAVGQSFSVSVAANRSVVRVGDPIGLEVTLRGEGNLERLSLPNLSNSDALNEAHFQLPAELPSGTFADNTKQFKVTVRIKDQSVDQIPSIAFSWFDPEREEYQTTYSKPIAVQVREAQMIDAADVVSAAPAQVPEAPEASSTARVANAASAVSLLGANLAIERNTAKLLSGAGIWWAQPWFQWTAYGIGLVAIAFGLITRRRLDQNPVEIASKRSRHEARRRLQDSGKLPPRQAAEQVARALRETLATVGEPVPAGFRTEMEKLISECESHVYAPEGADLGQAATSLRDRGLALVDQISRKQKL